jgi:iron complex transport system ATP-binding protein
MMNRKSEEILSLEALMVGYISGKRKHKLFPPVYAKAKKGELVAVLGRNGIGKSTLLRTIMGLQPLLGGSVYIDGRQGSEYSRQELARKAGYISTEIVRASNMKVYDLVALGRFPYTGWTGSNDPEGQAAIDFALDKTGMTSFANRYVSELSDGERQRAMIARVLAQETDILIMDEPTAFLDISGRYEMIHLMSRLARDGRTIVFSTHDFNIALNQADKIWLILDNSIIEGSPEDLVLKGSFNNLFDPGLVGFNHKDGTFSLLPEKRGELFVKGEGLIRDWTVRALARLGYTISDNYSVPYLITPVGENAKWIIVLENSTIEFESIYSLAEWLVRNKDIIVCNTSCNSL